MNSSALENSVKFHFAKVHKSVLTQTVCILSTPPPWASSKGVVLYLEKLVTVLVAQQSDGIVQPHHSAHPYVTLRNVPAYTGIQLHLQIYMSLYRERLHHHVETLHNLL